MYERRFASILFFWLFCGLAGVAFLERDFFSLFTYFLFRGYLDLICEEYDLYWVLSRATSPC
ncbi:hypothetical protein P168DRAFT_166942 [Aspergillus campestris IBT 28561]|uniref:Uncharacterized protein n=1 Tax=Aspergillus campestris (strain IBT 28561) TaxID=1392248 RepID=A0A2I1D190_ASPC2|nr:uncharacterized protein P168DRAFT_166942 [Aspergillus campestris IBT 28561]PKY03633.1 hypothetical protein P168DRAFT_166942 [Aspergillus campestris IBT 28561]